MCHDKMVNVKNEKAFKIYTPNPNPYSDSDKSTKKWQQNILEVKKKH